MFFFVCVLLLLFNTSFFLAWSRLMCWRFLFVWPNAVIFLLVFNSPNAVFFCQMPFNFLCVWWMQLIPLFFSVVALECAGVFCLFGQMLCVCAAAAAAF